MAKATKLASGNWRVRAYDYTDADGKKHYKSFTASTKKEAEFLAAEYYTKKTDEQTTYTDMTVAQGIEKYIASMDKVLSPSTVRVYDQTLRLYLQPLMPIKLSKLTNTMIQDAVNAEAVGHAPKTVRNSVALLSATLKRYRPDFAMHINLPQKQKPSIQIPTEEEMQKVLQCAEGTEMEAPLLLAACLGLRRSEILGLKWDKINFETGTICIDTAVVYDINYTPTAKPPKSASGYRVLTVAPYILDVLKRDKAKAKSDYVTTLTGKQLYSRFDRILRNLGLPHYRLHDLRHYHASVMLAMGVPDKYAMQRMGHATDNMLKNVYQHIMTQKKNEIDDTLDSYFANFLRQKE